jgi:hypothetical protein
MLTVDYGDEYLERFVGRVKTEPTDPDIDMTVTASTEPPRVHRSPVHREPTVQHREPDQGRRQIVTTYHNEPADGADDEVRIWRTVTTQYELTPRRGMDNQFPWRSADDPLHRVYEPYAAEDGSVHPEVLARVDQITANISGGQYPLERIARNAEDTRLPVRVQLGERRSDTAQYLGDVVWRQLEHAVAAEIRRLTRGTPHEHPVTPGRVEENHVRPHERPLIGQWGLFLRTAEHRSGPRPSLLNGRILGVYLGAVLDTEEASTTWARTYSRYPDYRMDVPTGPRRTTTMSAEGAANSIAFANTAITADTRRPNYDRNAINACFVNFTVRMPDRHGGYRDQPIAVLVALENAFDPVLNPYGMIVVEYGDDYLRYFRPAKPVKREPE